MWSQFAATPRKLSPLSCCIIWSAIFPHVTLLCDQDRHGVYARRHLLNYSKAPLSLHVSFVVVSGGIRGPLTFTSFAREWTQVGLALLPVNGVEVRREADEEGDGEKRWVFFSAAKCCVCVCVRWPAYPSPFVSLCGAAVSAGGGHVKSQTLASRMAPLPGFSPSHPFSRFHSILLACSYEHIFSLLEWGQGGGGGGEGGKTNTSKASRNRVYSCIWRGHLLLSDFHMAPKNRRLPVFPPIILQFALKYKPLWLIACHI